MSRPNRYKGSIPEQIGDDVLDYIYDEMEAHHRFPTVRKIKDRFELSSTSSVDRTLNYLREIGKLVRDGDYFRVPGARWVRPDKESAD